MCTVEVVHVEVAVFALQVAQQTTVASGTIIMQEAAGLSV